MNKKRIETYFDSLERKNIFPSFESNGSTTFHVNSIHGLSVTNGLSISSKSKGTITKKKKGRIIIRIEANELISRIGSF